MVVAEGALVAVHLQDVATGVEGDVVMVLLMVSMVAGDSYLYLFVVADLNVASRNVAVGEDVVMDGGSQSVVVVVAGAVLAGCADEPSWVVVVVVEIVAVVVAFVGDPAVDLELIFAS